MTLFPAHTNCSVETNNKKIRAAGLCPSHVQWPLNSHASGKVLTIIIDFCRTNATSCHHRSFRQPVGLLSVLMINSHSVWIYTSCHVHLCPHKLKTCIFFTNHSVTNLTGCYLCWCQFALSIVSLRYLMLAITG